MDFPSKVRKLLVERRMSQADLAEALGTSQQQVSRWLESNKPPKASYLLRLSRALGVTADYLIDDAQDEPAPSPGMHPDEVYLVRVVRGIGLGFEEAVSRLWAGEPGGKALGEARLLRDRDLEGEARRLGPEPGEKGRVVAEGQDDRPRPGDGL